MLRAMTALTTFHTVIHVHANNFAAWGVVGEIAAPTVLEVTFCRTEGKAFSPADHTFPTPLDRANWSEMPDYYLGRFRYSDSR